MLKSLSSFFLLFLVIFTIASCGSKKKNSEKDVAETKEAPLVTSADELFMLGEGQHVQFEAAPFNENWRTDNHIIVQLSKEVSSLHPTNGRNATVQELFQYIHGYLIRPNIKNLSYKAAILAELPKISEDGLIYYCSINPNARFDDGSKISVEDIEFTFKTLACAHTVNANLNGFIHDLASFEKVDDHNFILKFNRLNIANISNLSLLPIQQKSIYDPKAALVHFSINDLKNEEPEKSNEVVRNWAENYQTNFGTSPENVLGSGGYKVIEFTDQKIVLAKKAKHWTNQNGPEKITFKVTPDLAARMLEVKNQMVDVARSFSSTIMKQMMADDDIVANYHLTHVPSYNIVMMAPNLKPRNGKASIFSDINVRKAFAHALLVEDLITNLSNGTAVAVSTFIPVLKAESHRGLKPIPYDLEKVDSLLALSGWGDANNDGIKDKKVDGQLLNLKVEITSQQGGLWQMIAGILVEGLKKAGFDASVNYLDGTAFANVYGKTKDFDVVFFQGGSSFGPDFSLELFDKDQYPEGNNFGGYENPKADSLIQFIQTSLDGNIRTEALMELQQLIYDEQPYFFLISGQPGIVIHKRLGAASVYSPMPHVLLNEFNVSH